MFKQANTQRFYSLKYFQRNMNILNLRLKFIYLLKALHNGVSVRIIK
jgi:hypothetical protein